MTVHALPPSSVRSLTSTQTLTSPPSLIKELVENSIDAGSTVISVEISNNCIDLLQVKDNGQGILPGEDRECVAKRWWTSKITKWEDLVTWRGEGGSLGFRGEALASASEMAESFTVTTRVDGEKVGAVLLYDRQGNIISRSSKSVPMGTTVKVTGFLKYLPVRRQTAIRSSLKHVAQVRRTLVTYALSHPAIRFSLRVLPPGSKANSMSGTGPGENWIHSPSKTVAESVMKLFGNELASNCTWIESQCKTPGKEVKVRIDALLVKPGIDPSTLIKSKNLNLGAGGNHYIFVDSRPISCSRPGPFKSLLSLYKKYLKSSSEEDISASDPFIYMNIRCSPGLYDPNIEPAKDDVLFEDWDRDVLEVVNSVFTEVYGELELEERNHMRRDKGKEKEKLGFDVLLARKQAPPAKDVDEPEQLDRVQIQVEATPMTVVEEDLRSFNTTQTTIRDIPIIDEQVLAELDKDLETPDATHPPAPTTEETISTPPPKRKRKSTWLYNMYEDPESDEDKEGRLSSSPAHTLQEPETVSPKDKVLLSNPWVIAKLNTSSPNRGRDSGNATRSDGNRVSAAMISPTRSTEERGRIGPVGLLTSSDSAHTSPTRPRRNSTSPVAFVANSRRGHGQVDNFTKPADFSSTKQQLFHTPTKFAGVNGPNGVVSSGSNGAGANTPASRNSNEYVLTRAPDPSRFNNANLQYTNPYNPPISVQTNKIDAYVMNRTIAGRQPLSTKRRKLGVGPNVADHDIFQDEAEKERFLRDADDEELLGMLLTQHPPVRHPQRSPPPLPLPRVEQSSNAFTPIKAARPVQQPSERNKNPNPIPSPPSKFHKSAHLQPLPLEYVPPQHRGNNIVLNIETPSLNTLIHLVQDQIRNGGGYGAKNPGFSSLNSTEEKHPTYAAKDKEVGDKLKSWLVSVVNMRAKEQRDQGIDFISLLMRLKSFEILEVDEGEVGMLRARWE